MKLLLTSAGVSNASIHDALVGLLGKPISESTALFIPTAVYGISEGASLAYQDITGADDSRFCNIGWKSVGVLELTTLSTLKRELWTSWVQKADALLVGGGDPLYLAHWMRRSGFAELLPSLKSETVYVGLSAGSMVAAPDFGRETYGNLDLPESDEKGLGLVDFAVFPHLNHGWFPGNTIENAAKQATKGAIPTYAIDDQTALQVVDGTAEVISEGEWKLCLP